MKTALEDLDPDDPRTRQFKEAVYDKRNHTMAEEIAKRLWAHPETSYLFAVASVHVPGPDGIQALLTKKGYRLTRLMAG